MRGSFWHDRPAIDVGAGIGPKRFRHCRSSYSVQAGDDKSFVEGGRLKPTILSRRIQPPTETTFRFLGGSAVAPITKGDIFCSPCAVGLAGAPQGANAYGEHGKTCVPLSTTKHGSEKQEATLAGVNPPIFNRGEGPCRQWAICLALTSCSESKGMFTSHGVPVGLLESRA